MKEKTFQRLTSALLWTGWILMQVAGMCAAIKDSFISALALVGVLCVINAVLIILTVKMVDRIENDKQ